MRNFIVVANHAFPGDVLRDSIFKKNAKNALDAVGRLIVEKDWQESFARVEFITLPHGVYRFSGNYVNGWVIPK
jgi:hypothetical protein